MRRELAARTGVARRRELAARTGLATRRAPVSVLADVLGAQAIGELLDLAEAAAGWATIELRDAEGRHVAGRSIESDAAGHPITFEGRSVGAVVGSAEAKPELLALVARAFELALTGTRDQAERNRVMSELTIGRRIQLALLPRRFPDIDGWTFGAHYEAAREIGGDLYDAFPVRGRADRFALVIADVTGKGIPAALLMADVRALLHAAVDNTEAPAEALRRVNRILVEERSTSLFVTAALLIVDAASGATRFASAGHEPPILARRNGDLEALEAAGPILGAFIDASFEEQVTELAPGDALVLYTDGVTETRDAARGFLGEARLRDSITSACGRPAAEIVAEVMRGVRGFRGEAEPFDDLTLLAVSRTLDGPSRVAPGLQPI